MNLSADLNVEMVQSPIYLHRRGDGSREACIAFQTLPQEILCEIAKLSIANGAYVKQLNQVCASMRSAVNGTMYFWQSFTLGYGVR